MNAIQNSAPATKLPKWSDDPSRSVREARQIYYQENNFGEDGGYSNPWVDFKLGPLPMRIPNDASHVRALRFHDVHHVATGYTTEFFSECQIATWELGDRCGDHYVNAWFINFFGMGTGLLFQPRKTFQAFLRGRHSRNLYKEPSVEPYLDMTVGELQAALGLDKPTPAAEARDILSFALHTPVALATLAVWTVTVLPLACLAGTVAQWSRSKQKPAPATTP